MEASCWSDLSTPDLEFQNLYNAIGPFPSIEDPSIPISVVRSMQPKPDERTSFPGVNVAESLAGVRKSHIEIPLAANAEKLGANPARGFLVHGESAGANLAIVCSLLARDEKLQPPITGLSASIPAVLSPDAVPEKYKAQYLSHVQNESAPGLDEKAMNYLVGNYQPDTSSPLFNCFNWPTGHAGLPPVHIQVCGLDPLRDEGLLYEHVLRTEYGVRTKLTVYPGLPHAFWSMFPMLESARKAIDNTSAGFAWLLDNNEL
ncbi:hypothetical protein G7054_g11423 [Neopestalotiopsis clavispora]|nr:hypothetical protein G7054_g11423 [Neopestalotiopsis clavispora]